MSDAPENAPPARLNGERRAVGHHNPLDAGAGDRMWLILRGELDLYLTPMLNGEPAGVATHLLTLGCGDALFGMPPVPLNPDDPDGVQLCLRAAAAMGSDVFEAPRSALEDGDVDLTVVGWIEGWIEKLGAALSRGLPLPPHALAEADPGVVAPPETAISAHHGAVLWVRADAGSGRYLGRDEARLRAGDPPIPLTERTWLSPDEPLTVSGFLTPTALLGGFVGPALDRFHALAMAVLVRDVVDREKQRADRLRRGRATADRDFAAAVARIGRALGDDFSGDPGCGEIRNGENRGAETGDPLAAARLVAAELGVDLPSPPSETPAADRLAVALTRADLRMRPATLESGWEKNETGPLLAFFKQDQAAVALLPVYGGGYALIDPRDGVRRPVDAATAARIDPQVVIFYAPLPPGRLGLRDMARFAARGLGRDLRALAGWSAVSALSALAVPAAAGFTVGHLAALSAGGAGQILLPAVGLLLAGAGAAVAETVRAVALLRVETRVDGALQAALWDRLLRLPPRFFRNYTAGDLAQRVNAVQIMREVVGAGAVQAAIGAAFSVFSLAALFWFAPGLAVAALGVAAVAALLLGWETRRLVAAQSAALTSAGAVEGATFQMLSAAAKLRCAGAEPRAFARFAYGFAERQRHTFAARTVEARMQTWLTLTPVAATALMFAIAAPGPDGDGGLTTAAFVGFNVAFGQFVVAASALVQAAGTLALLKPLYRRLLPILETEPETDVPAPVVPVFDAAVSGAFGFGAFGFGVAGSTVGGAGGTASPRVAASPVDPGPLGGAVRFSRVRFRYAPDAPPVFNDLSLTVEPGRFVAFVGPSGCGKSTLGRLLLGFERPEAGAVYLDGRDLAGLDVRAVRRQIGVVLQDGRLQAGAVFENIVGGTNGTLQDAWRAARAAGLESDLRAMPMGMHTAVTAGGGSLSGGQRQRLLIARALARDPRIVLFDEATSALDNPTQAVIGRTLEQLNVTRIVVAHRLSTVVGAHRIYVLGDGGVVESGSFQELLARDGAFAALARRQMF